MAIFDRWLDRAVARLGYVKADAVDEPLGEVFAGETSPFSSGLMGMGLDGVQRERLALTSAWVYSNFDLISNEGMVASLGVHRRVGEGTQEVVAHPFEMKMLQPNPFMGTAFLWKSSLLWLLLRGEAYWMLVDDQAGELQQVWPLPAARMRPIPDAKNYISGYEYTPLYGRKPKFLRVEDVCFYRRPNPFDFHRGLSSLRSYRLAMETDLAATNWNRDTFRKQVALRTLFMVKASTRKNFLQAKKDILFELQEKRRRHLVAHGDALDVKEFGLNHRDAEYLAGRAFSRDEIDRACGVPLGYWSERSNRANSEAAQSKLIRGAVWPLLVLMAAEVTSQILHRRYGKDLEARFGDIRPRDRRLLVQERRQYWQVATVDEARGELGKPPLEDGVLGGTLVSLLERGSGERGLQDGNGSGDGEIKADLRRWRSVALRRVREGQDPGGYDFESEHLAGVKADIRAQLKGVQTEEEVRAVFADLPFGSTSGKEFDGRVVKTRSGLERWMKESVERVMSKYQVEAAAAIEAGEEFDIDGMGEDLRGAVAPHLAEAAAERAEELAGEVGVAFDVAEVNAAALEWARSYSYELVTKLTETTRKLLQQVVAQYVATPGMTNEELFDLLTPAFGPVRAEMIGITEVTRAYSEAATWTQGQLRGWGVETARVWNTAGDDLVCPICGPLNGTLEIEWVRAFPDGPPAHPRCRCGVGLEVLR